MKLENDVLRVELDAATGGFASIFDKRFGWEYIGAPDRALLFRLIAPKPGAVYNHLNAAAPQISVDGMKATLKYALNGAQAIAELTLEGDAILASLTVTNTGDVNIEEVMFPMVRALAPLPGGEFIWPLWFRRRYGDPFGKDFGGDHLTWNEWTQKHDARYPGHLTTAWCDYSNAGHGIGLEGRHKDFSILDFSAHKIVEKTHDPIRRTLDLYTINPHRVKPGETYTASQVRIAVHAGDWHATADAHKSWLETWVKKPDRPKRFAEAIGWHFYFMKHQDDYVANTYADLPKMAQAALDAGCPYILLFGWQSGGHDNNYMYRYVPNEDWGGAKALREGVEKARAMGVEIMPFYNGTLANTEMPEHKEFGHRWEAKTYTGHPYYAGDWARHNFDAQTRNRAMLHHEIAPCAEMRPYFLETMKRIIQDYGFGNTQLDQIAEKMLVDYNEDHITSTPDRVYVDGMAELLPKVREYVREVNPEGVVISECLNDFTGQWCDSSWDWTCLLDYPEPVLYTLPWVFASLEVDGCEYEETNKAFAYKMHLDMKIDGGDSPITKYPKYAAFVKALADLRRRTADYYVYGDFRDEEGTRLRGPAGVMAKVYCNRAAGKVALVVAETAGKAASVSLDSHWNAAGNVRCESSTGATTTLAAGASYALDLQPYEVRVLCLDLAKGCCGGA